VDPRQGPRPFNEHRTLRSTLVTIVDTENLSRPYWCTWPSSSPTGGGRAVPPECARRPALGPIMIAGSYAGKRVVDRLPERVFVVVIEGTMTAAGLLFLIRG
jgi:hypothetical protein